MFAFSHHPQPPQPDIGFEWQDKILHAIAYFIFGAALGLMASAVVRRRWQYMFVLIAGALFAASDEWHQSFIPGRCMSAGDWIADVAGLILSLLILKKIRIFTEKRIGKDG
jgi:VanZ family protein